MGKIQGKGHASLLIAMLILLSKLSFCHAQIQLAEDWCLKDHEEKTGFTRRLTVYNCPPVSALLLLPFLWSPLKVRVHCPTSRVRFKLTVH